MKGYTKLPSTGSYQVWKKITKDEDSVNLMFIQKIDVDELKRRQRNERESKG